MTDQQKISSEDLVAAYTEKGIWDRTRYWYETWRKTTALIDPPEPWDELPVGIKLGMSAICHNVAQETKEDDKEDAEL